MWRMRLDPRCAELGDSLSTLLPLEGLDRAPSQTSTPNPAVPQPELITLCSPVFEESSQTKCHQLEDCLKHEDSGEQVVAVLEGCLQGLPQTEREDN